jgi:hypothetical protein
MALTSINFPVYTTANSLLAFNTNSALTEVLLPSLSTVKGYFQLRDNTALTYVNVPKLTYIGDYIVLCQNSPAFSIPSGQPNAPAGGLVVTGAKKGTVNCVLQQGTGSCDTYVTCP